MSLKSSDSYGAINYRIATEDLIKTHQHVPLLETVRRLYEDRGMQPENAIKKAKDSIVWEKHPKQTIPNVKLFGVHHRPDFVAYIDGMSVAIEVKKGDKGSGLREGLGQCLVYSTRYDFVIFLFIDISKSKKIVDSMVNDDEMAIVEDLWEHNNVLFNVV